MGRARNGRGLSRRELIKASAAAGAAAWTAPMIVDSLVSPAAAVSTPCASSLTCSWIYVLFRVSGTYYVAGFNLNASTCGGGGANPHGDFCNGSGGDEACETGSASGVAFKIFNFTGSATSSDFAYSTSGSCGGVMSTPTLLTTTTTPSCSTYLSVSGGNIVAQGGAEIVSAIGFGGSQGLHALCPQSSGADNQVCAPASGC
jgi:hypothetical protein